MWCLNRPTDVFSLRYSVGEKVEQVIVRALEKRTKSILTPKSIFLEKENKGVVRILNIKQFPIPTQ